MSGGVTRKLSDADLDVAELAHQNGESARSIARRMGVSHVALIKRLRRRRDALVANDVTGWGEFDETDVRIILAVARAGIPEGLTELARYMECTLMDVVEVCVAYNVNVTVLPLQEE